MSLIMLNIEKKISQKKKLEQGPVSRKCWENSTEY